MKRTTTDVDTKELVIGGARLEPVQSTSHNNLRVDRPEIAIEQMQRVLP